MIFVAFTTWIGLFGRVQQVNELDNRHVSILFRAVLPVSLETKVFSKSKSLLKNNYAPWGRMSLSM